MSTEFEDITKDFEAAARDMVTGEYLSDGEIFSLNSAMYATDSGDQQLDPAFGCTKILIGDEHLAGPTPTIPLPDMRLDPRLVVGAMDRALSAFGAWNAGLGCGLHTIYSCVYFQLSEGVITSAWLKPFVQGIVCIHDFLMPHIKASSITKSEDACALDCKQFNDRDLPIRHLSPAEQREHNAKLATPAHVAEVMRSLDSALAALPQIADPEGPKAGEADAKPNPLLYGTADKDVEEKVPEEMRRQVAEAISARLLLVRHLLDLHKSLDACNVSQARKAAHLCMDKILPKISATLALGAEEPKGTFNPESWRRARGPIFVRRFEFPSVEKGLEILREQLEDILEICNLTTLEVYDYLSLFHWVRCFMLAHRERNIFARIWLSHLLKLTEKWLKKPPPELTMGSFNIVPIPKMVADDDRALNIEARIAMTWEATLDAFLLNRARLFRKLPDIFARWDELQPEAAGVDGELLKAYPMDVPELASNKRKGLFFFMYVLHVKLMLIVEYLTCGLTLDVYLQHEYRYVLWYSEYLLGIAQTCINDSNAQYAVFERLHKKKGKQTKTDKKWALYRELYMNYVNAYLLSVRGLVRVNGRKKIHILLDFK